MNVVYVTGNEYKANLFSQMVGLEIPNMKLDVEEIQDIDLKKVVEHKAREAHRLAKQPVLVEDTKLEFSALGRLPGPFIKWFLEELGPEGLCKMLDNYNDRTAIAGSAIAYYDGKVLKIFESELKGSIAKEPRGNNGFGWNVNFIPHGSKKTFGEMDPEEFEKHYKKVKPFEQVAKFLK